MGKVNVLSEEVSQLIAAGEVVERPVSIVKELLENSIDAGATNIQIEIKNGGKTLIRIKDNGEGFFKEDIKIAFLRHATSKLKFKDDLDRINTLGFRGEALASISSVSKLELITKRETDNFGTRYVLSGGKEEVFEEIGTYDGTIFTVEDLFFNVPARMKFLKKDKTEGNAVQSMVEHLSLSHPEISFSFFKDDKQCFRTPGDGELLSVIKSVFNRNIEEEMLFINYSDNYININGYISKPLYSRANRSFQNFFINSRYIHSKFLSICLESAYKDFIMSSRYPFCVLNIEIDASKYDVNVHPSKMEIRFEDENKIFNLLYNTIKLELLNFSKKVEVNLFNNKNYTNSFEDDTFTLNRTNIDNTFIELQYQKTPSISNELNVSTLTIERDNVKTSFTTPLVEIQKDKNINLIGEVFGTFIICEIDNELFFIDKHAAHERVLYHKIKRDIRKNIESQVLLQPLIITISAEEYSNILNNLSLLSKAGFIVEDFGQNTIIVREIPVFLKETDINYIITDISNNLINNFNNEVTYDKLDWFYESMACRAAIKANDKNNELEIIKLINDIIDFDIIKYCPHGRPIVVKIKKKDIEKIFGR